MGDQSATSRLPDPAADTQELVPYDEDAQRMLSRAFDIAIAQSADMVDVSHVTAALTEALP